MFGRCVEVDRRKETHFPLARLRPHPDAAPRDTKRLSRDPPRHNHATGPSDCAARFTNLPACINMGGCGHVDKWYVSASISPPLPS